METAIFKDAILDVVQWRAFIMFTSILLLDFKLLFHATIKEQESYAEHSNLYAYDLTPDLSACNGFHLNMVRKGTLGLFLTLKLRNQII